MTRTWVTILLVLFQLMTTTQGVRNASDILRRLGRTASALVRPNDWTGKPTIVNVSLHIQSFHALSEDSMELGMDFFYRRFWNDPRLQYEDGPEEVTVAPEAALKWMWTPDLFFPTARSVDTHSVLRPNYGARVRSNGDVLLSAKLTIRSYCPMDLRHFPLDVQQCTIPIESYLHTGDHIDLYWSKNGVSVRSDINPPAFFLENENHGVTKSVLVSGNYPKLYLTLRLRRLSIHYLVMTYLPSAVIVVLSCLVYWLPVSALAEKTFFSVFLFLSMSVIMAASQYGTPQVGYLKALDVWVVSCLLFLFFNILEVVVLYLLARAAGQSSRLDQFELMKDIDSTKTDSTTDNDPATAFLHPNLVRRIDLALRVIYPTAFVIFNIIYWSTYAN